MKYSENKIKSIFKENSFIRSVSILVSGTLGSQIILIASLPILTRIYAPEDFAGLASFASVLVIIASAACMRYEVAIPLAKCEEDADDLLILSILIAFVVSVTTLLALVCIEIGWIVFGYDSGQLDFFWLLPIGVFMSAMYSALQFWYARNNKFSSISKTKIGQSIIGVSVQLLSGSLGFGALGLVIGQIINGGAGCISLFTGWIRAGVRRFKISKLSNIAFEYKSFPKLSVPEVLANNGATHFPILIMVAMIDAKEVGFLFLAMRVVQAPMSFLGSAVSQVYHVTAAKDDKNRLADLTADTIKGLLKVGVGPLIFMAIISPKLFVLIFGVEWLRAGEIVQWLSIWFIFQFLASPISTVMHVVGRQGMMLVLTSFGLIIRVGAVIIASHIAIEHAVEFYAIAGAIFYMVCFVVFSSSAGVKIENVRGIVKAAWFPVLMCLVMAFIVNEILFKEI